MLKFCSERVVFIYLKLQQHSPKQNPVAQSDATFCRAEAPAFKQQLNTHESQRRSCRLALSCSEYCTECHVSQ